MIARILPIIRTWEQYRRVFGKRRIWVKAVRAVLARHGFSWGKVAAIFPGTCIVFMVRTREAQDVVVKLYAPIFRFDERRERIALEFLARHTGLKVPRVLASGVLRGRQAWPYLILRPIEGIPAREALRRVPGRQAERAAAALGRFMRVMHRASRGRFRLAGWHGAAWGKQSRRLIREATAKCRELPMFRRLVREGLAGKLARFTRSAPGPVPVLVHRDITEDHVLLERTRGRWRFGGVIDFADCCYAHAMLELFPLWFGALARKPNLLKSCLNAYSPGSKLSRAWRDAATAFCLLHEFGPGYLAHLLKRERANPARVDWDYLRSWIWPTGR